MSILTIIISLIVFSFLLELIIDLLNVKNLNSNIPAELNGIYDEAEYKKSQEYTKANTNFGFVNETFSFILSLSVLSMGLLGQINEYLAEHLGEGVILSMIFFGLLFMLSDAISLPFQIYGTFVLEEKFGFNKTTPKLFVIDKLKGYLLTFVLGGAVIWILMTLINVLGTNFWLYFWGVMAAIMFLMNMFYASWILPLFNKLAPLEDGELKTVITEYSKKVQFPLDNIFVIDGSKRSNKANAFFSGIGKKKKIVLYDTLINQLTTDELVAVLAHEVGHFKKKHIIGTFVLALAQVGFMLFLLSNFINNVQLSAALGASKNFPHLNLIAFTILYTPISMLTGIVMNLYSRKNEYEADAFASETFSNIHLIEALKKLSKNNLSNLTPHPALVFISYSHPTVLQRIRAMLN